MNGSIKLPRLDQKQDFITLQNEQCTVSRPERASDFLRWQLKIFGFADRALLYNSLTGRTISLCEQKRLLSILNGRSAFLERVDARVGEINFLRYKDVKWHIIEFYQPWPSLCVSIIKCILEASERTRLQSDIGQIICCFGMRLKFYTCSKTFMAPPPPAAIKARIKVVLILRCKFNQER